MVGREASQHWSNSGINVSEAGKHLGSGDDRWAWAKVSAAASDGTRATALVPSVGQNALEHLELFKLSLCRKLSALQGSRRV